MTDLLLGGSDAPVMIDVDGRPFWLFPTGETLPVVSGGIDDGGSGGDGDGGGDAGGDDQGDGDNADDGNDDDAQGDAGEDGKVEFTPEQQQHLSKLIASERSKAKKSAEAAAKKAIDQAAERAKMDEAERLKAEKADAEKAAKEATDRAHARLVRSEAKVLAVAEGVDPAKTDRFVKVLGSDLDGIEVDDDGEVDAKAVRKAVKATLQDYPEFKAAAGKAGASAGDMNGNGGKTSATSLEDAIAARIAS